MNSVAPNSPSEIGEREAGRDEQRPGRDRQVDLAPHPRGWRAEDRGRVAQPRVDRAQHREQDPARRTAPRSALGRSGRARAMRAGRGRMVERDDESEADRDGRRAERARAAVRRGRGRSRVATAAAGERERGQAADDERDRGGADREHERVADRLDRRARTACCRGAARTARGRSRARSRPRGRTTARRARRAGRRAQRGMVPRIAHDGRPLARVPRAGGRRRAGRGARSAWPWRRSMRPVTSEHRHDRDQLHDRRARPPSAGRGAARSGGRSRRRASSSAGPPSRSTTPNDGEREEERDRRRGHDRRAERRQRDRTERAGAGTRRAAGRFLLARVEMRPQPADHPHDDREVEEHVGEDDRGHRLLEPEHASGPPSPSRPRNADPDHDRREHERHDRARRAEPLAREVEAGDHVRARQRDDEGDARSTARPARP